MKNIRDYGINNDINRLFDRDYNMTPEQLIKNGTEHEIQRAFFAYVNAVVLFGFAAADDDCSYSLPNYAKGKYGCFNAIPSLAWLHAIPNGGLRNKVQAAKLKAEGVKSGVHDVFLPVKTKDFSGLYIEFKAGKNKLTKEQKEFQEHILKNGFKSACVNNLNDAINVLKSYFDYKL